MHNPSVVLSYGLGVDSTAILLRWLDDPSSRDFDLTDLVVVTAMTGDEWDHTKRDVEKHILPLLRRHGVRYVQVARSGRYVTKAGGVRVLDDSTNPQTLHLAGDFRLSSEMLGAGTVPQSGGARTCSVHAKGDVLDPTIARLTDGRPYRHVIGFEANEQSRARKDRLYNTALRTGEYPLVEWGWDRQACLDYIERKLGVIWHKSACVYCPFSLQNKASLTRQLELYRQHPAAAADALFMEQVSLPLNPTQSLIPRKPLSAVLGEEHEEAFVLLRERLRDTQHALYEVRRILRPRKTDPTKLANAARSVRALETGTRLAMTRLLEDQGGRWEPDGFHRFWLRERGDGFPAVEHFLTVAPAVVHDKQHDKFDEWWADAVRLSPAA